MLLDIAYRPFDDEEPTDEAKPAERTSQLLLAARAPEPPGPITDIKSAAAASSRCDTFRAGMQLDKQPIS